MPTLFDINAERASSRSKATRKDSTMASVNNRGSKSKPRTVSENDVLDLMSVDMSDPNNTGWFRVRRPLAEAALEIAGPNRLPIPRTVKEYADLMDGGKWENYTGGPAYFDKQGRFRRAGHRFRAVIRAKTDVEIIVWVVCGATESRIGPDDACQPWTTHDYMTQKTGDRRKSLAEVEFNVRRALSLEPKGHRINNGPACSEYYDRNAGFFALLQDRLSVIESHSLRRSLSQGPMLVVYKELYDEQPGLFDVVMSAIADYHEPTSYNFRELVAKAAGNYGYRGMKNVRAWTKYAIIKFLLGEKVGTLWALDSDFATLSCRKLKPGGRGDRRATEGHASPPV